MKTGSGKPVVGATLVAFAPTNSTKWGVSYLIYPCSTTVPASKDTNARINPPFASTIVFDRLESGRKWRDSPSFGRFAKAKMAISWIKCPCGCPFPAPARFHLLMWPLQGHGDSRERTSPRTTDTGRESKSPLRGLRALCGEPPPNLTSKNALPTMNVSQERFPAESPRPAKPRETT